ncbi:MAG: MBL fold metallo-hydrolase [Candidatus Merdivicinus sp.]|jgi:hydroxyacylglutathione hydrolase
MQLYVMQVGAIGTNCYLVSSESGNTAMIDPGAQAEKIISALTEKNLTPKMILLTHGHFDHIGAVEELRKRYQIPVYIHAEDAEMLSDSAKNGGMGLMGQHVTASYDHLVEDGDGIPLDELNFFVIHTPGHTKGSVCYMVDNVLLTGDTLFCQSIGRTDLYGGSYPEICQSLKKLADLEGDYRICPGHEQMSTLDFERKNNAYLGKMSYDDLI